MQYQVLSNYFALKNLSLHVGFNYFAYSDYLPLLFLINLLLVVVLLTFS